MDYFSRLWNEVMIWAGNMSQKEWLVVAGIAVVIGFFLMRGIGSRATY